MRICGWPDRDGRSRLAQHRDLAAAAATAAAAAPDVRTHRPLYVMSRLFLMNHLMLPTVLP